MKNKGIKLAKKALQNRPRRFSVIWMLPNFLTICALIFGLQAMYQAIFNNWDNVIVMIIIASVFDMLDGRVARLLKSTSEFGMHLDSLSDFVVFDLSLACENSTEECNAFSKSHDPMPLSSCRVLSSAVTRF